ncbi:MAG: DUF2238 domain-containing protein [Hahellaceae bacterium]|nr:DUF2238 domain-containing protein [Hahellaceae bacterium]
MSPAAASIARPTQPEVTVWTLIFSAVFVWSAIEPTDRLTWFLEVFPAILAFAVMAYTFHRFPLTRLLYGWVLAHCVVLMIGGHYTYALVPIPDWLGALIGTERNNYDKIGHFMQGFVPALAAREILIRLKVIPAAAWRNFFIVSFCLGFSAFYELIEWWVALASGESAEAFLGTQGYVWDTQSDMFLAMIGAINALIILGRWHDRQLGCYLHRM